MDTSELHIDVDPTAPATGRRSGPTARIEVMTRGARRSWSVGQKRDIVAESLGPGLTSTEVARKHAISSGQLYTWRRELLGAAAAMVQRSVPRFAQVEAPVTAPVAVGVSVSGIPCRAEGLIEIVLTGGVSVRVDAQVDGDALRRVLAALYGR